jgi:hypothetical protein
MQLSHLDFVQQKEAFNAKKLADSNSPETPAEEVKVAEDNAVGEIPQS